MPPEYAPKDFTIDNNEGIGNQRPSFTTPNVRVIKILIQGINKTINKNCAKIHLLMLSLNNSFDEKNNTIR
jgi:hypothetical protein|tara:strand:+ start:118 stop:330 length:213 start_codon:yes stop_codon:yes gene_type:complete